MDTVKIYRKDSGKDRPKATKAKIDATRKHLEIFCRVRRPDIEALFIPSKANGVSDFYNLPKLSPQVIDNRPLRMTEHGDAGWIVPESNLGRKGAADASTAQSVLLWVKKNLADVVNPEDVSIVVE
jgi:hypothetical protein